MVCAPRQVPREHLTDDGEALISQAGQALQSDLIALLIERDGRATRVEMRDGSALTFFWTNDVVRVSDPGVGTVLFPRA